MTQGKLVRTARRLRRDQTEVERKLWSRLRGRQLESTKFVRQEPIGNYIADFCARSIKLVVELDGRQHGTNDGIAADLARTEVIEGFGFRVIRFWNSDVYENIDGVIESIRREILLNTNRLEDID
jgi:very-short-patch-repair endonuclease